MHGGGLLGAKKSVPLLVPGTAGLGGRWNCRHSPSKGAQQLLRAALMSAKEGTNQCERWEPSSTDQTPEKACISVDHDKELPLARNMHCRRAMLESQKPKLRAVRQSGCDGRHSSQSLTRLEGIRIYVHSRVGRQCADGKGFGNQVQHPPPAAPVGGPGGPGCRAQSCGSPVPAQPL